MYNTFFLNNFIVVILKLIKINKNSELLKLKNILE